MKKKRFMQLLRVCRGCRDVPVQNMYTKTVHSGRPVIAMRTGERSFPSVCSNMSRQVSLQTECFAAESAYLLPV